jgi:hypothetical protein
MDPHKVAAMRIVAVPCTREEMTAKLTSIRSDFHRDGFVVKQAVQRPGRIHGHRCEVLSVTGIKELDKRLQPLPRSADGNG